MPSFSKPPGHGLPRFRPPEREGGKSRPSSVVRGRWSEPSLNRGMSVARLVGMRTVSVVKNVHITRNRTGFLQGILLGASIGAGVAGLAWLFAPKRLASGNRFDFDEEELGIGLGKVIPVGSA